MWLILLKKPADRQWVKLNSTNLGTTWSIHLTTAKSNNLTIAVTWLNILDQRDTNLFSTRKSSLLEKRYSVEGVEEILSITLLIMNIDSALQLGKCQAHVHYDSYYIFGCIIYILLYSMLSYTQLLIFFINKIVSKLSCSHLFYFIRSYLWSCLKN